MLDKLLFLLTLAGTAVVFADVLVADGMLLAPVQRWAWTAYRARTGGELGERWWWAPLWGCYKCVAGQWGFWGYLIYVARHLAIGPDYHPEFFRHWAAHLFGWLGRLWSTYSFREHLAFTAFTIIAAIILHKWTQE